MNMDEKIFNRVEKKYIIDSSTKAELLKEISAHMQPDGYHKSEVFNIYFDDDNYDLIIKSIERPKFKEKLRARSYGGYDKVFLEIKSKMKGEDYNLGYKRRVLITTNEYKSFVSGKKTLIDVAKNKIETPHDLQIATEVGYFVKHFNLKPRILVYYHRTSFKGENKLRITFDEDLRFRNHDLTFKKDRKDQKYFENEKKNTIMEIKAHGVMPLWLVHALSKNHVYPVQFSKIGKVYTKLNQRKEK